MEGERDACGVTEHEILKISIVYNSTDSITRHLQGDSGGGLICEGFLTGIVSNGYKCALPLIPGWYSDVRFYTPWIRKHVDLTSDLDYRVSTVQDNSAGVRSLSLLTFLLSSIAVIHTQSLFSQENK